MKFKDTQTPDQVLKELGRRLEYERLSRNISQAELAGRTGLSRRTIVRMEGGKPFRADALAAVLLQLGIQDRLEVVLQEPGLSPMQEARMEALRGRMPRRARASGVKRNPSNGRPATRIWGDGVPVGIPSKSKATIDNGGKE